MTKSEITKQRKRVEKLFYKWAKLLGLHWWNITVIFQEQPIAQEHYNRHLEGVTVPLMEVSSAWEYLEATVTIDLTQIALTDDSLLENSVIHELLHIILSQLHSSRVSKQSAIECRVEEHVVSHMTRSIENIILHYNRHSCK